MDKWEELTGRIQQAILAEEPEAAVAAAFAFAAEFGRQVERIANAFEPGPTGGTSINIKGGNDLQMVGVDEYFFSNYPERSGDGEHIIFNREDEERLVNRDDLEEFWNMLDEQAPAEDPAQKKFDL